MAQETPQRLDVGGIMTREYELSRGGWVKFDWDRDVQAVRPKWEDTLVTLYSGMSYLLRGRSYGV